MKVTTCALFGTLVTSALLLTGCSVPESGPQTQQRDLAPEAAAAHDSVMAHTVPVHAFEAPGPELGDLSTLAGSTVYYVPASYQIPMFHNVHDGIAEALEHLGITVQVCDGQTDLAQIEMCAQQAVDTGASAVISGGIPEEMAPTAFDTIRAAGIPLLFTQVTVDGPGDPAKVGYLSPDYVELQSWSAQRVIADSNATAEVMVVKVMDTPATIAWVEHGAEATYAEKCSECTVTILETDMAALADLSSSVAAEVAANPEIEYVHAAFDFVVQPILQGLESADRTDVRVVTQDGTLPIMHDLVAARHVIGVVGYNQRALGWYAADQTLRMMAGEESLQNPEFPYRRIFTRETASLVEFTPEAEKSGIWFGAMDYTDGFLKLWGVEGGSEPR